jgi:MFS family permease
VHVVFNIAICFSQSLPVLLLLRFLSGAFGAAPLTNCGGVIADTFPPKERGLAITIYALVPLFAPVLGPIMGEYVAGTLGWRCLMGFMALLSASALIVALVLLPETYAPILLYKRAKRLTDCTGRIYISVMTSKRGGPLNFSTSLATTLSRPFLLAAHEPIITILALYQAVVFGTLYLTFAAFPIAYIDLRGWPKEKSGLAFLGVLGGILLSVIFEIWDNRRYVKQVDKLRGKAAPPESRLLSCCVGGVSIVAGLFWIAGTADPNVHWMINAAAGIPFGFGIVLVTIGSTNYIVDSYTIFASSALAVCICARAICGAVFPLFVRRLFATIGVYWALSIPAFLSLLYVPFPFVLYYYGVDIRARCKYASEADLTARAARRTVNERSRLLPEQNGVHD